MVSTHPGTRGAAHGHLSNHHRNTLRQLFQHPVSHNIGWTAVVSLLRAVGTVVEQPHGKFAVTVGSATEYFDPPVHKDIDTQAVVDLRRMLSRAGYGAAAGHDGSAGPLSTPLERHRANRATASPVTETPPEPWADDPEAEAGATARVIFFSDAVVAIAITLLALALPLPSSTGSTTNAQLLSLLDGYWSQYLAFIISFLVIGSHWAAHRRIFRYVARVNHRVGQLTLLWLLMMVLTPFAARLLAGHGGFGVRFTLYVLIQVVASACLVLMSRVAEHAGLLRTDTPEAARHPDNVGSLTVIVMFTLSVPVAFFTTWAFALWAVVPLVARAVRRCLALRGVPAYSS